MSNKEILTTIQIKTEQSEKTIKQLKEEIKSLKGTLDEAVIGSDEFKQASKELADAQNALKTAMSEGKTVIENVDGSYNALVATMAELKKEWRATADEVRRNELGSQIDDINNQLKELDDTIGVHSRNVGNYAEDFKTALETQKKATENVRNGLDGLQKTASGLANGYAAVQGTMALLNIENSKFEETMIKVQSAMAIAQGVGGMKDLIEGAGTLKTVFSSAITAVKGFITGLHGLKAAIAATGIGLLVVALGTVIAYWDEISSLWKDTTPQDKARESIKDLNDELDRTKTIVGIENTNALKQYTQALKEAQGDIEKINEAQRVYNEQVRENNLKSAKENLENTLKAREDIFKAFSALDDDDRKDPENETVKQYEKIIADTLKYENEIAKIENEIEQDKQKRKANEIAENKKIEDEKIKQAKETSEKLKAQREKEKKEEETRIEKELKDAQDKAEKELKIKEHNIDREVELEERKLKQIKEKNDEWINDNNTNLDGNGDGWYSEEELNNYQAFLDSKKELFEIEINAENDIIQTQIDKLQELAAEQAKLGIDNTDTLESIEDLKFTLEENNNAILKNEKETLKAKEKANKEYQENQKKQEKLIADFKIKTASNILGSLTSILGEETKAGKAAAVAQATIDTYQAANSAYKAMAGIPIVGPGLGAAAAAAAIIAGVANVKKIVSTKTDGSGGVDISGANVTPQINMSEQMPIQYSRELLGDSETSNLNKEQRVIILESEMTEIQQRVKVKEDNSSF